MLVFKFVFAWVPIAIVYKTAQKLLAIVTDLSLSFVFRGPILVYVVAYITVATDQSRLSQCSVALRPTNLSKNVLWLAIVRRDTRDGRFIILSLKTRLLLVSFPDPHAHERGNFRTISWLHVLTC